MATQEHPAQEKSKTGGHIRIEEITKSFNNGNLIAVEEVNLDIGHDEFIVLVGPSGCGKTTTLRCIAGLEHPDTGQIFIGGNDVTDKKPKDRELAFVFQDIALFPHMTVRENIRFGLDMNTDLSDDEKEERISNAAEILGIIELLGRKPKELSGGQQQRVSLGRAMVMEPAAFLLDEPFSALDANLRDQMRIEVKKLQRELETSMIFVTHDQEEAMTLGDRIVVMNDARIQQIGSPDDIYNEPENLFVAKFIGSPSTNIVEGELSPTGPNLKLVTDNFTFELSDDQQARYSGSETQDVFVGIRPEYLTVTDGDGLLTAEVNVIESHGSRDAVYLSAGNQDLTVVADQGNVKADHGDTVGVDIDKEETWLFTKDGSRIL
jgi:multiple sugar transport system ATP-binding protein